MSESERSAAAGWLVVLPTEVSQASLERIRDEARARGWQADGSIGEEQVLLALAGPSGPEELGALLAGLVADVLPLRSPEHYRRLHARRRFLSLLVTGLGLAIAAGVLFPLLGYLRPPPSPILASELLRVGALEEIATGQARLVRFHDRPILVIRAAPHGWRALGAECTTPSHCLLEWDAERQRIVCPCHGCQFDAQGNVVHSPASMPLLRLEAFELHGSVFVRSLL